MLIFDIETEENLQCGVTSGGGAKGGGGGLATQGSAAIVQSTKKVSGAPSRSAGQPRARALDATFGELAKRGTTGRVSQPSLGAQRQIGNRAGNTAPGLKAGNTAPGLKAGNTAPKAAKATRTPKSVAQQNRDRIARGKAKAAKTNK